MADNHQAGGAQADASTATTAEASTEQAGSTFFDEVVRMTQDEAAEPDALLLRALLASPERTRQV